MTEIFKIKQTPKDRDPGSSENSGQDKYNPRPTKKPNNNQPPNQPTKQLFLHIPNLGIPYSNCRESKTKRKSWRRPWPGKGWGWLYTIGARGYKLHQTALQTPCKQEENSMKYLKYWKKKATKLQFFTLQNYPTKMEKLILRQTRIEGICCLERNVKSSFERRQITGLEN